MNKRKSWRDEFFITAPSFAWLVLFFLIPTLIVFAFAFKPHDFYGGTGEGWTLETFRSIFSYSYVAIAERTFVLSFLTTVISLLLSLPMGYYIARAPEKMRQLLLLLTILPFWSSFIIRIFAWKSLLHPEGFLKQLLVSFYVINDDTMLLYNPGTVLVVMVYSYLPFAILPIYSAASKFNLQLLEAAMDLGMNRLQSFYKVFIPGISRGIIIALIMVFIPALGAYVIPDVVGGAKSEMIGNKIVQRTFIDRNLPEASALSAMMALIILVPMAIFTFMQLRSNKRQKIKGRTT